ncbi:MAG TPA: DUF488 family protein [Actinomadura sp.]|nr:DUF488 family protein [Actinomadura sp.]
MAEAMTGPAEVRLRRVYEVPSQGDGTRVLVDRIWPRGLSREAAGLDHWDKEVAPSPALRRWYGHRAEMFPEFRRRFLVELCEPERARALGRLRELAGSGGVTLLTATRDIEHSHAAVLAEVLRSPAGEAERPPAGPGG